MLAGKKTMHEIVNFSELFKRQFYKIDLKHKKKQIVKYTINNKELTNTLIQDKQALKYFSSKQIKSLLDNILSYQDKKLAQTILDDLTLATYAQQFHLLEKFYLLLEIPWEEKESFDSLESTPPLSPAL